MASRARPGTRSLRRSGLVRLRLRGWGALGLAVLTGILAVALERRELWFVAGAAGLLPLLALAFLAVRRPRLRVSRTFSPAVAIAGQPVRVAVRLENTTGTPSLVLAAEDLLVWGEEVDPVVVGSIGVGARRAVTVEADVRPPRRGIYPVGPFVVAVEDPFGFAEATWALGEPDRLLVVPAVSALADSGPALLDGEGDAHLLQRRVAGRDDDLSTREYRPGDALRRVHWRASARHGDLMVRQEEHRSHPDARILVDTRLGGYRDAQPDPGRAWSAEWESASFEWVMRMTASLGLHLENAGFRVAVAESAGPQIAAIDDRGPVGRTSAFLESLATVHLVESRDPGSPSPPGEGRGPLFAILASPESATLDWVIGRRRPGESAIAFLADPTPEALSRLRDAGWSVVAARADDDPAEAWRAAGVSRDAS